MQVYVNMFFLTWHVGDRADRSYTNRFSFVNLNWLLIWLLSSNRSCFTGKTMSNTVYLLPGSLIIIRSDMWRRLIVMLLRVFTCVVLYVLQTHCLWTPGVITTLFSYIHIQMKTWLVWVLFCLDYNITRLVSFFVWGLDYCCLATERKSTTNLQNLLVGCI